MAATKQAKTVKKRRRRSRFNTILIMLAVLIVLVVATVFMRRAYESTAGGRENRNAHMTASAWIVDPTRTRTLMVYHNIYDSWSWTGGHADGETDLLSVALREAREETGIAHVHPVNTEIYSLEILTVDGHEKRGKYVSSHLHLNLTYLLEADDSDALMRKEDENSAVAWFSLEEAVRASSEPWFQKRIYPKLNAKLTGIG